MWTLLELFQVIEFSSDNSIKRNKSIRKEWFRVAKGKKPLCYELNCNKQFWAETGISHFGKDKPTEIPK